MADQIPEDFNWENLDLSIPQHRGYLEVALNQRAQLADQNRQLSENLAQAQGEARSARGERDATLANKDINKKLSDTLDRLSDNVSNTNTASCVSKYRGHPKQLNAWIRSIEKQVLINFGALDDRALIKAAFQSSEDGVSDFIQLKIEAAAAVPDGPPMTWRRLTIELRERFGLKLDLSSRLLALRKYSQRPSQSLQIFAEAVYREAADIYAHDINTAYAQHEIISVFAKGLSDRNIGKKILDEMPNSFEKAVKLAVSSEERQMRLRAHGFATPASDHHRNGHGRREQAMEVDYVQSTPPQTSRPPQRQMTFRCYACGGLGHYARDCRANPDANARYHANMQYQRPRYQRPQYQHAGPRPNRSGQNSHGQGRPITKNQSN